MKRYSGFLLLFLIVFLTISCKRNFQYSVLEVRPLAKNLNAKALEQIRQLPQKDTFSFLVISDTQIAYDELQRFVKHANKLDDRDQIAFVLHGGDFTDYGANFEYNLYYDDIKKTKAPCGRGNRQPRHARKRPRDLRTNVRPRKLFIYIWQKQIHFLQFQLTGSCL